MTDYGDNWESDYHDARRTERTDRRLDIMGLWIGVTCAAATLNVLLLLGLSSVWARNYREFRSKHTLGLLVFGLLLLAENALAVYVFLLDPMLSVWFASDSMHSVAGTAMMALRVLETVAVLALGWVTLD